MKKQWVAQPSILHWFWHKTWEDKISESGLEDDNELVEWCWQNDCEIQHTWVMCPNKEVFTMFALRWS